MLTTSLRSAVRASAVSLPSVNPTAGAAIAVPKLLETASNGLHQRRYSSSKPPVPPNDGSRPIDTSSQAPAKGVSPTGQKRDGKTAKRRAKESRRNGSGKSSQSSAFLNLPSVPSTQHLQPQGLWICLRCSPRKSFLLTFFGGVVQTCMWHRSFPFIVPCRSLPLFRRQPARTRSTRFSTRRLRGKVPTT